MPSLGCSLWFQDTFTGKGEKKKDLSSYPCHLKFSRGASNPSIYQALDYNILNANYIPLCTMKCKFCFQVLKLTVFFFIFVWGTLWNIAVLKFCWYGMASTVQLLENNYTHLFSPWVLANAVVYFLPVLWLFHKALALSVMATLLLPNMAQQLRL